LGGWNLRKESRWNQLSGDQLIPTQSIPIQPSAHSRVANTWEPIQHVSWENGCTIGAIVSTLIDAGIFAIVVMVSLLSLMRSCLQRCQASVVALIACCKAGAVVAALVMMVLLPSMCRHLHRFCNGDCCSCHGGIVAVVDVQASPLLLS
jgi:hypothetical protein